MGADAGLRARCSEWIHGDAAEGTPDSPGLAALLAPQAAHNALLGAGFGALHLIFGAYLKERGRNASQGR